MAETRRGRRGWKRWLFRGLKLLALLVLGLFVLLWAALHNDRFRQVLLDLAEETFEERTGFQAEAGDFELALWSGRLEITDLRLAAAGPESAPFLTLPRLELSISPRSLVSGDRILVRSAVGHGLVLDLGAPLPVLETREGAGSAPAFDIASLRLARATVRSPLAPESETGFHRWLLEDLQLDGHLIDGTAALEIDAGRLTLDSRRRPPIEAAVRLAAQRRADGRVELSRLELLGSGLHLTARGGGRYAPEADLGDELDLDFELEADLGRLVPNLTPEGSLVATGQISGAESGVGNPWRATATLHVTNLPAELLGPWIRPPSGGSRSIDRIDLAGTHLDSDAELVLGDSLEGRADIVWRRGEEALLTAHAATRSRPDGGASLDFRAKALPRRRGTRTVQGELRTPGLHGFGQTLGGGAGLESLELAGVRIEVKEEDVRSAALDLGLSPSTVDRWGLAGRLSAGAHAEGPLTRPRLGGELTWRREGRRMLIAHASSRDGVDLISSGPVGLDFEAEALPDSPGRVRLAGSLRALPSRGLVTWELTETSLELDLPDLAEMDRELGTGWPVILETLDRLPARSEILAGALTARLQAKGPLACPVVELEALWRSAAGERVSLEARGRLAPWEDLAVSLRLAAQRLGQRRGRTEGNPETVYLETTEAEAEVRSRTVELTSWTATLGPALGGGRLHASGRLEIEPFAATARVRFDPDFDRGLDGGLPGVERADADLRLEGGILYLDPLELRWQGAQWDTPPAVLRAEAPLGAPWPAAIRDLLARLPGPRPSGSILVETDGFELAPLADRLEFALLQPGGSGDPLRVSGRVVGTLNLDPQRPAASAAELRVIGLELESGSVRVGASDEVRLLLVDRRLTLEPVSWRIGGLAEGTVQRLITSGHLRLAADPWPGEARVAWIENLAVNVHGAIDAAAVAPLLAGGVASGRLQVDAHLEGAPSALSGEIRLQGPEATVYFARPYASRIEGPEADVLVRPGELEIRRARASLNRGEVTLLGRWTREAGLDVAARLEDLRYRLDYGLSILLDGDLALRWPPDDTGRLTGQIAVERGTLRRDLNLDQELLGRLFSPPEPTVRDLSLLDSVEIEVTVSTREGVWVANNLAKLHVDWNPLEVRGTIAQPSVQGTLDVDPGGRVTVVGQTFRLDEASLTLSADPTVEPRLVVETTSSLEDPSVREDNRWVHAAGWGQRGRWSTGFFGPGKRGGDLTEELSAGARGHYTERLMSALTGGLGRTELRLEPLPVFGETDTEARLTASQRVSPNLTYILSLNPRQGEARTDLVEIHGLRQAPGVVAQLFSNDDGNPGATLQQSLELGGTRRDTEAPRLRRVDIEVDREIEPRRLRRLRRAIGLKKGDEVSEGADFDAELDVADDLRDQGFPGAAVRVTHHAGRDGLADLAVAVELGPRVEVRFEGERLSRTSRERIAALYQPGRLVEAASLEEMQRETERALRGRGFVGPEVHLTVEPDDPTLPSGARTVRVLAAAGRRIDPGPPVFVGVEGEAEAMLRQTFEGRPERVELAAGSATAEELLEQTLRRLGLPEARVVSRSLSDDGRELTIEIETGRRRRIGEVRIEGAEDAEAKRLAGSLDLGVGDPLRTDSLTRAVQTLEDELRGRGHAAAEVDVEVEPLGDGEMTAQVAVVLRVRSGPVFRIEEVRFDGLSSSRGSWAAATAGLEPGQLLTAQTLGEARRRLYETGVFRSIRSSRQLEAPEPGAPESGTVEGGARIDFEVEEAPRYTVAYGGRWESDEGLGGIVYAADRNAFGRGHTIGVQASYAGEDRSGLGFYYAWPRFLGSGRLLELFAERRREIRNDLLQRLTRSWAQLTLPGRGTTKNRVYVAFEERVFPDFETRSGEVVDLSFTAPFFGWQMLRDTRDRALGRALEKGQFVGLDVSVAAESLGADVDLLRLFGQWKSYRPLGAFSDSGSRTPGRDRRSPVWAQSFRLGWIEPFGPKLPEPIRLRAGGEYSVRGYATDSLGPLDPPGTPIGGEVFLVVNEEIQMPLWRSLEGVGFFDVGNVWESIGDVELDLSTSVGLGLRAPSPIGPLRLDLAIPLDRRDGLDPRYKVYVGFGPTF